MDKFLAELKRRQMFRVAAAYAVVAWLILQVVNNVAPGLNLPNWAVTLVIVLLAAGFPVALLFCWIQQLAPGGDATQVKTNRLDWILAGGLAAVIALILYQQLAPPGRTGAAQQQASVAPTVPSPASPVSISIAVLPLANLSDDRAQEFFSDGMTDEINAALAKVPGLNVVARTSAFEFKGQNRNVRAVGEALGATHIIEGSVRRAGERVRITAQLVRAGDGLNLWSETYDRELTDIFAVQEEIARAIAASLRLPLGLREGDTLVPNRTDDLESYQQYLRAKALVRARALSEAIAILEPATGRDPTYAPAWALLAVAYELTPQYEGGVRGGSVDAARRFVQSAFDKAEMAAREAVMLDPRHAGGYAALAYIQTYRKNWATSDDLFRQALALDPNDPEILHLYSLTLSTTGRVRQALSMREQLRALEPFVPVYNAFTAVLLQINGLNEASIPLLEALPQEGAGAVQRGLPLARGYAAAGRLNEAAAALDGMLASLNYSKQSADDAARLLRDVAAKRAAPQPLPILEDELNFVYTYLGAADRAFEAYERGLEVLGGNSILRTLWLPLHAPLRKTERFKTLIRNAGLVDYWRVRGWPDLCRPVGADDFTCD